MKIAIVKPHILKHIFWFCTN